MLSGAAFSVPERQPVRRCAMMRHTRARNASGSARTSSLCTRITRYPASSNASRRQMSRRHAARSVRCSLPFVLERRRATRGYSRSGCSVSPPIRIAGLSSRLGQPRTHQQQPHQCLHPRLGADAHVRERAAGTPAPRAPGGIAARRAPMDRDGRASRPGRSGVTQRVADRDQIVVREHRRRAVATRAPARRSEACRASCTSAACARCPTTPGRRNAVWPIARDVHANRVSRDAGSGASEERGRGRVTERVAGAQQGCERLAPIAQTHSACPRRRGRRGTAARRRPLVRGSRLAPASARSRRAKRAPGRSGSRSARDASSRNCARRSARDAATVHSVHERPFLGGSQRRDSRPDWPLGVGARGRRARSAAGSSRRSPERRSQSSTMPSAAPRPTITIVGTPSSSASPNFTPGETLGRSS